MPSPLPLGLGLPTPPTAFFPSLLIFHLFPLHAPLTLYILDAPFGRFANKTSGWNVNGNIAWAAMEIVSPITFISTLLLNPHPPLNRPTTILAGLYIAHYAHRAVISPLLLSPKRSPLHVTVPLAAAIFNLLNGYLLAIGLAFYPPSSEMGWTFYLGVVGWAAGFMGNVLHDEILNDLRRDPDERLILSGDLPEDKAKENETGDATSSAKTNSALGSSSTSDSGPGSGSKSKRYKIPRGGLFRYVSFPNYLCEWLEWTFFSLAASPRPLIPLPPLSALQLQSSSSSGPISNLLLSIASYIGQVWWPTYLLAPGWMFLLAEVTSMLPRALRGHGWYKEKFGDQYPSERKAVIPGLL
ncbi:hypothetical protein IAT40_006075 [Kwoniella sp. CBS 6097]